MYYRRQRNSWGAEVGDRKGIGFPKKEMKEKHEKERGFTMSSSVCRKETEENRITKWQIKGIRLFRVREKTKTQNRVRGSKGFPFSFYRIEKKHHRGIRSHLFMDEDSVSQSRVNETVWNFQSSPYKSRSRRNKGRTRNLIHDMMIQWVRRHLMKSQKEWTP